MPLPSEQPSSEPDLDARLSAGSVGGGRPVPLDRSYLESLFGADEETIELMIGLFVDSVEPWQQRLLNEPGPSELRALAHEIKGAAGSVGARTLAQMATDMELAVAEVLKQWAGGESPDSDELAQPHLQDYRVALLAQLEEVRVWSAARR